MTNIPACLSGLTDQPAYQPIYPGWLTDQHTSQYIWVDWPNNIPAYLSGLIPDYLSQLNDWPKYLTIYPGWLTNQHTSLSAWQHTSLIPSRLTDRPAYLIISVRVDWPTNMPKYLSKLIDNTNLSVWVDWPTNILAYPSGLTEAILKISWFAVLLPTHQNWSYPQAIAIL